MQTSMIEHGEVGELELDADGRLGHTAKRADAGPGHAVPHDQRRRARSCRARRRRSSRLASSPWQTASLEIGSVIGVAAVVVVLWLISQLLTALYFRIIATTLQTHSVCREAGAFD